MKIVGFGEGGGRGRIELAGWCMRVGKMWWVGGYDFDD